MKKFRWGIIGPGKIAHKFAEAIQNVEGSELYAVASRNGDSAKNFAQKYNVPNYYGSYEFLVKDINVDAVYVATPHAFHKEHTLLCLNHKKPVLCEKPLAHKLEDVIEMVNASKTTNTFLMEAMWSRHLPAVFKTLELIHGGHIGQVLSVEADFGFQAPFDVASRLYDLKLGGGSLMDVGVYPLFLALTLLGKPKSISSSAILSSTGADISCEIKLTYTSTTALLKSSIVENTKKQAIIKGSEGEIYFDTPWYHPVNITLVKLNDKREYFDFGYKGNGFEAQIKEAINCIEKGKIESSIMSHEFSILQSEVLDEICQQCKIVYP